MLKSLLTGLLLAATCVCAPAEARPNYAVVQKISVPGDGGWDYLTLDPSSHRLFVTRGSHVQVVNVNTGQVVGDILDTPGVHGVALAGPEQRGFTSNGKGNTITVFGLDKLNTVAVIPAGTKPDAIIYEPITHRVLAFNGESKNCTVIDAKTLKVVGTVALGGSPEFAASDERGHVFVNLEDSSEVVEFDAASLLVLGHWPLAPGEEPTGLSIDKAGHRLFAGCHNRRMVIFDTLEHRVVETLPIGAGVDATAFDPGLKVALSSNGDGTLTIIGGRTLSVLQNVVTSPGARTMALDPETHKVYLVTALMMSNPTPEERKQGKRPRYAPGTFTVWVIAPEE